MLYFEQKTKIEKNECLIHFLQKKKNLDDLKNWQKKTDMSGIKVVENIPC